MVSFSIRSARAGAISPLNWLPGKPTMMYSTGPIVIPNAPQVVARTPGYLLAQGARSKPEADRKGDVSDRGAGPAPTARAAAARRP